MARAAPGTGMAPPATLVGTVTGTTELDPSSTTKTVRPSGAIAIALGDGPAGMAALATLVAVDTGVTVPAEVLVAYSVSPSGVTAKPPGSGPMAKAGPGALVEVDTGVAVPLLLATNRMPPLGAKVIARGAGPTVTFAPMVSSAVVTVRTTLLAASATNNVLPSALI